MTANPISEPELVERIARALSVPQHHTTWDILTAPEKDLFYMQAECVLREFPELSRRAMTVLDFEPDEEKAKIAAIVEKVSNAFRADLLAITSPTRKPHKFVLDDASGIRICSVCGRPDMLSANIQGCQP